MKNTLTILSKFSVGIGFILLALFIFEFIGEFSSQMEGAYHSLGIPWRYPMFTAIIAFGVGMFLDRGTRKYAMAGFMGLAVLFLSLITIYLIVFFNFASVGG
ncbi:hypothetical protein [Sutcliffiella horikoshii]|uniref:hypothetical protein n=1 Tax=Sutcliffiella horikoshii TaxID=79883 RepID=UPI001F465C9C|nr:hypothetical protein [Sutcliffiella horikoshii]MCG1023266.1 hypothetical protein [Sutcliffiella horikoshii]